MTDARKQPPAPGSTSHLYASRKSGQRGAQFTSERIAADMAAFRKAGGKIEKLGDTRTLQRIGATTDPAEGHGPEGTASSPDSKPA